MDGTLLEIGDDELSQAFEDIQKLTARLGSVVRWEPHDIELVIASMLCGGHVLLEGRPGIGKTEFAKALARLVSADFKRIQCTPDLMPSDITGYFDPRTNAFRKGPVFAEIVLVDELNRAQARTQSALLEAMAERSVTVDGVTYHLPEGGAGRSARSFFVIATQNPIEHRGVNDLPEAQLDRFLLLLSPDYPSEEDERRMLLDRRVGNPLDGLENAADRLPAERFRALIALVQRVKTHEVRVIDYILRIVRATRTEPDRIELGASPRSALHLMALCKAYALVHEGRRYVTEQDVKDVAPHVLSHRILPAASLQEVAGAAEVKRRVILDIVAKVPPPG